jgi:hypothetical protein
VDVLTARPYRERVVTIGDPNMLVGVITLPAAPQADAPFVVLLNPGIIHRVGANRFHVRLARTLAEIGLTTLRFDLAGIGDSSRPRGASSLQEAVDRDVESALDFLQSEYGAKRFVLAGLCSGAYDALHGALRDSRVVGLVMLDIPGPFQTWHHVVNHVAQRLFRRQNWHSPFKRATRLVRSVMNPAPPRKASDPPFIEGIRPIAPRETMEKEFDMLLARSVKMFFAFTPGVPENYNHRGQFRRCFPRAAAHANVTFEYMPNSDHTFSTRSARDHMTRLIRDWMLKVTR